MKLRGHLWWIKNEIEDIFKVWPIATLKYSHDSICDSILVG